MDDPEPVFNEATGKWEWPPLEPLKITAENVRRVIERFPPEKVLPPDGPAYGVYAVRGRPKDCSGNPDWFISGGLPSLGKGYS
jgi:hypothetical protein